MKHLLAFILLMLASFTAGAASNAVVIFDYKNFMGASGSAMDVVLQPTDEPRTNGTAIVTGQSVTRKTSAAGIATFTNVLWGTNAFYRADLQSPGKVRTVYILVPTNTAQYAADLLVTVAGSGSVTAGYSQAQANAAFIAKTGGIGTNTSFYGALGLNGVSINNWSDISGSGGINTNVNVAFSTNVSVGGTFTANVGSMSSLSANTLTLTEPIPPNAGGTGRSNLTSGTLIVGNGTNTPSLLAGASAGQVVSWNGSAWVNSNAPSGIGETFTLDGIPDVGYVMGMSNTIVSSFISDTNGISATTGTNIALAITRSELIASNYPSLIAQRQFGSVTLSNLAGTGALTNAAAFQPASATLTNLAGTGALTNASAVQASSMVLSNIVGSGALTNPSAYQASSMVLSNAVGTGILTNAAAFVPSNALTPLVIFGAGSATVSSNAGAYTVDVSAGGGDVTTAQLLTVSNQVQATSNSIAPTALAQARAELVASNFLQSLNGAQPTNNALTLAIGTGIVTNGAAILTFQSSTNYANSVASTAVQTSTNYANGVTNSSIVRTNDTTWFVRGVAPGANITTTTNDGVVTVNGGAGGAASTNLDTANIGWAQFTNGFRTLRTNNIGQSLYDYGMTVDNSGNVAIGTNGQSAALAIYGTNEYLLQIGSRRLADNSGGTNALTLKTNGNMTVIGAITAGNSVIATASFNGSAGAASKDVLIGPRWTIGGTGTSGDVLLKNESGLTTARLVSSNLFLSGSMTLGASNMPAANIVFFTGATSSPSFAANNGSIYLSGLGEMWLMATNWTRVK